MLQQGGLEKEIASGPQGTQPTVKWIHEKTSWGSEGGRWNIYNVNRRVPFGRLYKYGL